jgi:hypothetical protein
MTLPQGISAEFLATLWIFNIVRLWTLDTEKVTIKKFRLGQLCRDGFITRKEVGK